MKCIKDSKTGVNFIFNYLDHIVFYKVNCLKLKDKKFKYFDKYLSF